MRTDQRLARWYWRGSGVLRWRQDKFRRRAGFGWRVELQHSPHPCGVAALRGMPQAGVADFVEPAGQHVLEEATHELAAAQTAGSPPAGLAFPVLDGDRLVVEAESRALVRATRKT